MKSIKISDATYLKIKSRIEDQPEARSFEDYIRQMLFFFSETGTNPFFIKDVPTVEIKNNTDKLLKEVDRLIKIVKAQERDANLNRDKQTSEILTGVTSGSVVVQEEKITSDVFRDINNIKCSNSEWRQILELAQERCFIMEKQDKIIQDLEKKVSMYEGQPHVDLVKNNTIVSEDNSFKSVFLEFVELSKTENDIYPVCNQVDAEILSKYKNQLYELVEDESEDTLSALKEFFANYRTKEEKGNILTLVNRDMFENATREVLNTLY
ncbi:MAG: BfmA/BtgA family mobilization protein [Dysgonomonas sp.]